MEAYVQDAISPEQDSGLVKLSDCIQFMHAGLVHAHPTPENLDHGVIDVLMYDPLGAWPRCDNRIILAVGFAYHSPQFDQMLHLASRSNAAAVIVKAHGERMEHLREAAVRHELAVLVAPDDLDWARLATLARASVVGVTADSVSGVRLGDLYAFADAVASMTGGAASIVGPLGQILGYSTLPGQPIDEVRRATTLALHEREAPTSDADFKKVYAASSALFISSTTEGMARLALAVRAGEELLGSIWIVDPGKENQQRALEALNRMAPLAGLHMIHAWSASDHGERRNSDLIRTLIDDPERASHAAAELGLDARRGLAVAAFSITHAHAKSLEAVRESHRLLHLVTTVCSVQFKAIHCALLGSVVYVLLPCTGIDPRVTHRRIAQNIGTYGHTVSSHPLVAAVGSIAAGVEDLPRSRSEALQILGYVQRQHPASTDARDTTAPVVALFEDHRIPLGLLKVGKFLQESGLDCFDELTVISAYDAEHQTAYMDTLRAYLNMNGSTSAMASLLHVHSNTVRYRVAQLSRTFNVNLEDPKNRLWLWLRLTSLDLAAPA